MKMAVEHVNEQESTALMADELENKKYTCSNQLSQRDSSQICNTEQLADTKGGTH